MQKEDHRGVICRKCLEMFVKNIIKLLKFTVIPSSKSYVLRVLTFIRNRSIENGNMLSCPLHTSTTSAMSPLAS
jgi:hypothetical protein